MYLFAVKHHKIKFYLHIWYESNNDIGTYKQL